MLSTALKITDRELTDLSLEYWRKGEVQESLAVAEMAYERATVDSEKFIAARGLAVSLSACGEHEKALALLASLRPEDVEDAGTRGGCFAQRAFTLADLGERQLALIDYAGAAECFEQSGNLPGLAAIKNNEADILSLEGEHERAHKAVDEARSMFTRLGDQLLIAMGADQKAQLYLRQGETEKAEPFTNTAVGLCERLDQPTRLANALITQGTVYARQSDLRALAILVRAGELCEFSGDKEMAGRAYLTILEECKFSWYEKANLYSNKLRVFRAQRKLMKQFSVSPCKELIAETLRQTDDNFDRSAKLLGISRPAIIKAAKKFKIPTKPTRTRRKSLLKS